MITWYFNLNYCVVNTSCLNYTLKCLDISSSLDVWSILGLPKHDEYGRGDCHSMCSCSSWEAYHWLSGRIIFTKQSLELYWSKISEGMPEALRLGTRRGQCLLLVEMLPFNEANTYGMEWTK